MWDLPGPGLEPVSPALAGGFLTTAPPGKPPCLGFLVFSEELYLPAEDFQQKQLGCLWVLIGA